MEIFQHASHSRKQKALSVEKKTFLLGEFDRTGSPFEFDVVEAVPTGDSGYLRISCLRKLQNCNMLIPSSVEVLEMYVTGLVEHVDLVDFMVVFLMRGGFMMRGQSSMRWK